MKFDELYESIVNEFLTDREKEYMKSPEYQEQEDRIKDNKIQRMKEFDADWARHDADQAALNKKHALKAGRYGFRGAFRKDGKKVPAAEYTPNKGWKDLSPDDPRNKVMTGTRKSKPVSPKPVWPQRFIKNENLGGAMFTSARYAKEADKAHKAGVKPRTPGQFYGGIAGKTVDALDPSVWGQKAGLAKKGKLGQAAQAGLDWSWLAWPAAKLRKIPQWVSRNPKKAKAIGAAGTVGGSAFMKGSSSYSGYPDMGSMSMAGVQEQQKVT